jgi:hypothetical protein
MAKNGSNSIVEHKDKDQTSKLFVLAEQCRITNKKLFILENINFSNKMNEELFLHWCRDVGYLNHR